MIFLNMDNNNLLHSTNKSNNRALPHRAQTACMETKGRFHLSSGNNEKVLSII